MNFIVSGKRVQVLIFAICPPVTCEKVFVDHQSHKTLQEN
jgi:hypothetical protein